MRPPTNSTQSKSASDMAVIAPNDPLVARKVEQAVNDTAISERQILVFLKVVMSIVLSFF